MNPLLKYKGKDPNGLLIIKYTQGCFEVKYPGWNVPQCFEVNDLVTCLTNELPLYRVLETKERENQKTDIWQKVKNE